MSYGVLIFMFVVAILVYVSSPTKEDFLEAKFIEMNDTQFKGINLLGVNSNDTDIPCASREECRFICASKETCKGYSYYSSGQRCYIYGTGDFVQGIPGFQAGKKF